MQIPTLLEMLEAGVHFGHQTSRWHPKMKPFIFTERNGIHIIDLEKTRKELERTLAEVKKLAAQGQTILFVTTKPQAKEIVRQAAIECGMPYLVERWVGGLLTNFDQMKRMIQTYVSLKEQQKTGELEKYTKKEQLKIGEDLDKKDKTLAGLATLTRMPNALFVPALQREKTAVEEAIRTGVAVIGIADTNANPQRADYVIPANDDAVRSIQIMVQLVADAIIEGKKEAQKNESVEIAK